MVCNRYFHILAYILRKHSQGRHPPISTQLCEWFINVCTLSSNELPNEVVKKTLTSPTYPVWRYSQQFTRLTTTKVVIWSYALPVGQRRAHRAIRVLSHSVAFVGCRPHLRSVHYYTHEVNQCNSQFPLGRRKSARPLQPSIHFNSSWKWKCISSY